MALDADRWDEALREGVARHGVPGAVVGVSTAGERAALAAGLVNLDTGVAATTDAVFPIASITKAWTATLILQLHDRGALSIDQPVSELLPEVALGGAPGDGPITVGHLLSHTSGLDADRFVDTGRGADALARYARGCSDLARVAAPGTVFSYGNAGFNLCGHIVERLTGEVFDDALCAALIAPLGLERTVSLPEDALAFRTAVGHVGGRVAATWPVPRSAGPAGGLLASTADLLDFAELHLAGGRTPAGERLIGPDAVALMQAPRVVLPDPRVARAWGLGWMVMDWDGTTVIGHDGGAVGIAARLRMLPEHGTAIAIMANGGHADALVDDLLDEIVGGLHGVRRARVEAFTASGAVAPDDLGAYAGRYTRAGWDLTTRVDGDRLVGTLRVEEPITSELGTDTLELEFRALDAERFVQRRLGGTDDDWSSAAFLDLPDQGRFVHMWSRTTPKVA